MSVDWLQVVARNLRYLRQKAGLNQCKLADKLDISQHDVSSYETQRTVPTLYTLIKYSEALNIPLNEILNSELVKDGKDS